MVIFYCPLHLRIILPINQLKLLQCVWKYDKCENKFIYFNEYARYVLGCRFDWNVTTLTGISSLLWCSRKYSYKVIVTNSSPSLCWRNNLRFFFNVLLLLVLIMCFRLIQSELYQPEKSTLVLSELTPRYLFSGVGLLLLSYTFEISKGLHFTSGLTHDPVVCFWRNTWDLSVLACLPAGTFWMH